MSSKVRIVDGEGGTNRTVKVTSIGQIVTSTYEYDTVKVITLNSSGVAQNLFPPISGNRFVITGIYLTAKKNITQDVIVNIYTGTSLTDTTIASDVFPVEMLKSTIRDFPTLNVRLSEGDFLNAKADDADVIVTATGYYVPA